MKCYHCPRRKETNVRSNDNWEKVCDWVCGANKNELIAVSIESDDARHIFSPSWCPEKVKCYTIDDLRVAFEGGGLIVSWSDMGVEMKNKSFDVWFEEWNKSKKA